MHEVRYKKLELHILIISCVNKFNQQFHFHFRYLVTFIKNITKILIIYTSIPISYQNTVL